MLQSAVANAEYKGREANEPVDVDTLYVKHAMINEGPKLKRFMPAAMGRATPVQKRTSHVEIVVGAARGAGASCRQAASRWRQADEGAGRERRVGVARRPSGARRTRDRGRASKRGQ